ncbi:NAD-dependent 15-hydroxyprostaglandin dehydrogenase (short-chain dehydrogenase) [Zalerion maritima]|uniref:NAD-dependent 15-hydroxyprostaglandin dehydrogenase (Short-chain dehydrogenase) n=1 Tax=Zalerion maritima TaxID=339359 RepID=A0AAD5WPG5_9PEZI|nr:NAD-dependent 15-hydroxyprostaglandin dehydrogenase (short-chain dehydrogenase) [Zalerion maritima]
MSFSVTGKYAIITGAGSGINLEFAKLLLSRGCSVLIGDLIQRPEAEKVTKEYSSSSGGKPTAHFHKTDVASWPSLTSLIQEGLRLFPQIDIVVPGAGVFEPAWSSFWNPPGTTESRDAADGGRYATIDINLTHPIRLSQLALKYWTEKKIQGCLLHVSSIAGHSSGIGTPLYFASKNGLHAFVRSLGGLKEKLGIRVGAVAPGAVITPMWLEDPEKMAMAKGFEFIQPEEIANSMLELCEKDHYGDGTILEVTKGATRVVPQYNQPPPAGEGSMVPGFLKAQEDLYESLRMEGLKGPKL